MAIVLAAFASNLSKLLFDMAKDEVGMLLGVSGDLKKLGKTLTDLRRFLDDADRRRITDDVVQGWATELKDAMYDATNILDLCHLKAEERRGGCLDVNVGCLNPLLYCMRNPCFARGIGKKIKELNRKLDDIAKRASHLNFINLGNYDDNEHRHSSLRRGGTIHSAAGFIQADLVGDKIEEDTRSLVGMLIDEGLGKSTDQDDNVMVVAVVGAGGIGKTTLAKKVFDDEEIKQKFTCRIWLSVTQDFKGVDLLKSVFVGFGGDQANLGWIQDNEPLEKALEKVAGHKTFLLVMDNMWSAAAWNKVLRVPLLRAGAHGSRILVTTRKQGVARKMKAAHTHRVNRLELEDAWALLKKQVNWDSIGVSDQEGLQTTGMKIVEKCGGLPLAIIVVGGSLCRRDINKRAWKEVLEAPSWSIAGLPKNINKAIYLSYEDLSSPLKECFLYYSLLPKGRVIGRQRIVAMWIAEGFVQDTGGSNSLEVLGGEYYRELIMRNLLEPQDEYYDQGHCVMHDVVRSFAQHMARDEALEVQEARNMGNLSSSKFHRLCISSKEVDWSLLRKQETLRTFILMGNIMTSPGDSFSVLPSLRTLHVYSAKIATMIASICQLKHLRYLDLNYTDIATLPDDIGKMEFLQHLGLLGSQNLVQLPSSIVKLKNLRFLSIRETKIREIPRGFGGLKDLVSVDGFPVHMVRNNAENWCSLEEVGPLSKLTLLRLEGLENVASKSVAECAELGAKMNLTALDLCCTSRLTKDGQVLEEAVTKKAEVLITEVFGQLCPPTCLERLTIEGYFGQLLPSWMMVTSDLLQNLRWLKLQDLALCIQLPVGLGQLPNLDYLEINRAPCIKHIRMLQEKEEEEEDELTLPPPVQAVGPAFCKLKDLSFLGMVELESWDWEKEVAAMPTLEVLYIKDCKLGYLPQGLACHAKALKKIVISNVKNLSTIANIPSVVELEVVSNHDLSTIINLARLQRLTIVRCPKLMVLDDIAAIRDIFLHDEEMETLPCYLRNVAARQLHVSCSLVLFNLLSRGRVYNGTEWHKITHIQQVSVYARDGNKINTWNGSATGMTTIGDTPSPRFKGKSSKRLPRLRSKALTIAARIERLQQEEI